MARKIVNWGLFIPLLILFAIALTSVIWNQFAEHPIRNYTIQFVIYSVPLFLIFLSWNVIRLFKNKIVLWISVFVLPTLVFIANFFIIEWSNWGTLGGGESYLTIAINGFLFGGIAAVIALIGNIVIATRK